MLAALSTASRPAGRYDVAIIGAGPAGISLAIVLARRGQRVFLAEGGGLSFDERSQEVYRGEIQGDDYLPLEYVRLRQFGGSSGHWGGFCRRLDPEDFRPKAASAQTGWPITEADLSPFTARALALVQAPPFKPDEPLPGTQNLVKLNYSMSPPTQFGEFYRPVIESERLLDAFYECNFTGFTLNGGRVRRARFQNWTGHAVEITADRFILACGGIENSRLLLYENQKHGDRLGNQSGLVGAYWSEHFSYPLGDLLALDKELFAVSTEGHTQLWAPTAAFIQRAKILNCNIEVIPPVRTGAKGAMQDLLCVAPDFAGKVLGKLGRDLDCFTDVMIHLEQEPRRQNRIVLGSEKDVFGTPRSVLQIHKSRLDRRTIRTIALEFGRYVAHQDVGRFRIAQWLLRDTTPYPTGHEFYNFHLMGGTRMAATAAEGVVDRDCKVFGTDNLYVAGSSVFPSGGHAKPTFTILQLALRLADHLTLGR